MNDYKEYLNSNLLSVEFKSFVCFINNKNIEEKIIDK